MNEHRSITRIFQAYRYFKLMYKTTFTWVAALGIRLATEEAKRAEISDIFHKFLISVARPLYFSARVSSVVEPEMT